MKLKAESACRHATKLDARAKMELESSCEARLVEAEQSVRRQGPTLNARKPPAAVSCQPRLSLLPACFLLPEYFMLPSSLHCLFFHLLPALLRDR